MAWPSGAQVSSTFFHVVWVCFRVACVVFHVACPGFKPLPVYVSVLLKCVVMLLVKVLVAWVCFRVACMCVLLFLFSWCMYGFYAACAFFQCVCVCVCVCVDFVCLWFSCFLWRLSCSLCQFYVACVGFSHCLCVLVLLVCFYAACAVFDPFEDHTELCNQLCLSGQLDGHLAWQKLWCWALHANFSTKYFSIPAVLIGSIYFSFYTTFNHLDFGWGSQGQFKEILFGFSFLYTFCQIRMTYWCGDQGVQVNILIPFLNET